MIRVFVILLLHLASLASILGLYFTLFPLSEHRPTWHIVALTSLTIAFAASSIWEIWAYVKTRPKIFKLSEPFRIKNYMRQWLMHGGRAVIFTRDMSWADSQDVRVALHEKARRNELTICIEAPIPLTHELAASGAEILPYAELGHVPRSRFTIVDYGRDGARVAVGGTVNGKHMIQEFASGQHPFFSVAEDLVKIILAYQRRANV